MDIKTERSYRDAEKRYAKQVYISNIEMNIRVAIGFGEKSPTEILKKINLDYPGKSYGWLRSHLSRMIKQGLIDEVLIKGKRKYKVSIR